MPVAQFKLSPKAGTPTSPESSSIRRSSRQAAPPAQQSVAVSSAVEPEENKGNVWTAGFPDPYKILADVRKVVIYKELSSTAKCINCLFSVCGVTRYRYYVRDASTGRDIFKAKMSYSASCNVCAGGTRHNYSLDLFLLPLDGSKFLKEQASKALFLSTSTSDKSKIAVGGHGVTDMRNLELIGRLIPSPSGSIAVKDAAQATAFRIALPVSVGFAANSSEMQIEDGSTTALVGRIAKQWGKSDNDMALLCCCWTGTNHGPYTLDISAVSNVKKRALLVMAGIIADAVSFNFRAAPPIVVKEEKDDDKPLIN